MIWAHWLLPSGLIGAVLKFFLGKPLVVTVHSGDVHFLRRIFLGRTLLKFVVHQADRVTVVCHFVRRELSKLLSADDEKLLEERLETIPMGVRPLRQIETLSDSGDLIVLYLGRLVRIKGVEVLIEALSDFKERTNRPIKLWIIGEGCEKNRLRRLAAEKQIRTAFLGSLGGDEKMAVLQRADIVVIPSLMLESKRTEGLPVTLLEALSSGKAIIASEVGGIPEVIRDGWNGLLVPPGDIRRLTECLTELIGNPVKRKFLGKNAILTSHDFDISRIGDRFVDIFTNLYEGNPTRLETPRLPLKIHLPGSAELLTK
jgi:glycosyltransferase involved in cell wall biosynthesis